jgi:hypothetical protein
LNDAFNAAAISASVGVFGAVATVAQLAIATVATSVKNNFVFIIGSLIA